MKKTSLPLVSIIMSAFNDEQYIARAIESVLSQDFKNWEFLIVDDMSTDGTKKIINKYEKKDLRIKLISNSKNLGLTKNLNKLIKIAKGKYIARIDSDDVWISIEKLSHQVKFLERNPTYCLIGSWAIAIDTSDRELFRLSYPTKDKDIRATMLKYNCFLHNAVVFRKDTADKVGNYDENFITCQDYDLWMRLGLEGKIANSPEYMVKYLMNPLGISQSKYVKQIDNIIFIIKKYKNVYPNFNYNTVLLYEIRKRYPKRFRGEFSMKLKDNIRKVLHI